MITVKDTQGGHSSRELTGRREYAIEEEKGQGRKGERIESLFEVIPYKEI
jgi:hypothetical protein